MLVSVWTFVVVEVASLRIVVGLGVVTTTSVVTATDVVMVSLVFSADVVVMGSVVVLAGTAVSVSASLVVVKNPFDVVGRSVVDVSGAVLVDSVLADRLDIVLVVVDGHVGPVMVGLTGARQQRTRLPSMVVTPSHSLE